MEVVFGRQIKWREQLAWNQRAYAKTRCREHKNAAARKQRHFCVERKKLLLWWLGAGVAYGVRNIEPLDIFLKEFGEVGGRLVILRFVAPGIARH